MKKLVILLVPIFIFAACNPSDGGSTPGGQPGGGGGGPTPSGCGAAFDAKKNPLDVAVEFDSAAQKCHLSEQQVEGIVDTL